MLPFTTTSPRRRRPSRLRVVAARASARRPSPRRPRPTPAASRAPSRAPSDVAIPRRRSTASAPLLRASLGARARLASRFKYLRARYPTLSGRLRAARAPLFAVARAFASFSYPLPFRASSTRFRVDARPRPRRDVASIARDGSPSRDPLAWSRDPSMGVTRPVGRHTRTDRVVRCVIKYGVSYTIARSATSRRRGRARETRARARRATRETRPFSTRADSRRRSRNRRATAKREEGLETNERTTRRREERRTAARARARWRTRDGGAMYARRRARAGDANDAAGGQTAGNGSGRRRDDDARRARTTRRRGREREDG